MKIAFTFLVLFLSQKAFSKACLTTMDMTKVGGPAVVKICSEVNGLDIGEKQIKSLCAKSEGEDYLKKKNEILDTCPANYIAKCKKTGKVINDLATKFVPKDKKKEARTSLADDSIYMVYYYTKENLDVFSNTCADGEWTKK